MGHIRWYFYTINARGMKCFDEADLGKMLRKFIMIIYNSSCSGPPIPVKGEAGIDF